MEKTFIYKCLCGEIPISDIDRYVSQWHNEKNISNTSLKEFLGMTEKEYNAWLLNPSVLESIITARKENMEEHKNRLDKIIELKENWNGYGAKIIPDILKETTLIILKQLLYSPELYPTARQSITLEYEFEDGSLLDLEIFQNVYTLYFSCNEIKIEKFNSIDDLTKQANDIFVFKKESIRLY